MILYNAPSSYYSMIARYALLESHIPFENRRMDIHFAKEQLTAWYMALNPQMTVPTLMDGKQIWINSQDIVHFAAQRAGQEWMDSDEELNLYIQQIVYAHYNITIERLTFGKALINIPLMRFIIPRMLVKIIKKLEKEQKTTANLPALEAKIILNEQRLAFFTQGTLQEKLELERHSVRSFLDKLPEPPYLLFGDKPSSADIVTAVLLARLQMIGEYDLVTSPQLIAWFGRMQQRTACKDADLWTHFQPWRIVLKR